MWVYIGYACLTIAVVVGAGFAILYWHAKRRASPDRIVSFVYLLRAHRGLEIQQIRKAVARALGDNPAIKVVPTERTNCFIIQTPDVALGLADVNGPYVPDVGEAADRIRDFLCKKAMQEHQAWLAVDQIGDPPLDGTAISYRYIGRIMAELAGDDVLAIYCPENDQMNSYGLDLPALLRSNQPMQALVQPRAVKTVHVADDDEEMAAAVAEARRRWPQFEAAFRKRRTMQGFAVKVPFREGESLEFMWVEISSIDGEVLHGNLVSDPEIISSLKLNDEVVVDLKDLNDWMYSDGREMIGGFTAKVLERRH